MEIKALCSFATLSFSAAPGQVYTCSEELAEDLIRAGYAVKAGKEPEKKPVENKEEQKEENDDQRSDNGNAVPAAPRKRSRAKSK